MRKTINLGIMALFLAIVPTACCDGDGNLQGNNETPSEKVSEAVPDPTDDQTQVKYSGMTTIMGTDLSGFGQALAKRMTNRSEQLTDDVKAVVLTPQTLQDGITADQAAELIKLYEAGTCVILLDPQNANWERMGNVLEQGEEKLEEEGYCSTQIHTFLQRLEMLRNQGADADDAQTDNDAVAFHKNSTYIVSDLEKQAELSIQNTQATITDENGQEVTKNAADMDYEVSDYRYGQSADLLVQWLKNADEEEKQLEQGKAAALVEMKTRGATGVLEDLLEAQTVIKQQSVGPSRVFGKTMPCEFYYYIYALYSFDRKEEYYFIRQHINFHAYQLGCKDNNDVSAWTSSPKGKAIKYDDGSIEYDEKFFGPYMRKSKITTRLEDVDSRDVELVGPLPESTSGSHGYSYGFSKGVNISGNLGKNSQGAVGGVTLGASWGWSESKNYSAPDLTIQQEYDSHCMTSWLLEGLKPEVVAHWYWFNDHTLVSNFQVSDWSADLTWCYRIKNPDMRKSYSILVTDYTEIAELNNSRFDYELAVHPTQSHRVELTPPNRYCQEWIMTCTNSELLNNIKSQLKLSWDNNLMTYALTEQLLDDNMAKKFTDIQKKVKGLADVLVTQGFTDTYVFSVRKAGVERDFMSFVLDHGEVRDGQ